MSTAIERVDAALERAGAPCLWHGESEGAPQPENGARSCAQCERRQDKLVFDQPTLTELVRLARLGERVEQCEDTFVVDSGVLTPRGRFYAAQSLLTWIQEGS